MMTNDEEEQQQREISMDTLRILKWAQVFKTMNYR